MTVSIATFPTVSGIYIDAVPELVATSHYDEDGRQIHKDIWRVQATLRNGRRFAHVVDFNPSIGHSEEYQCAFVVDQNEMQLNAERFAARIANALNLGGQLDMQHWHEIDPEYGSDAYQSQGIEAQRAAEERLAG